MDGFTPETMIDEIEHFASSSGLDQIIPQEALNLGVAFSLIAQDVAKGDCDCDACTRIREIVSNF